MLNDINYDYVTNTWSNLLSIPTMLSESNKTFHLRSETPEQISVNISAINPFNGEFTHWIQTLLNPGHAVLAGYKGLPPNASGVSPNVPGGHVFVIAKTDNNTIIYIDPQVPPDGMICDVSQFENTFLRNKQGPWYLLFNSAEKISDIQQQQIVEYVATG